ncbi:MAG: IS200/IS605 family transposase [Candidatus Berkiellales bacterium]
MTHSFRSHYFHLIWSTKNRANCITDEIKPRLYAFMGGIVKNHGASLVKIGGTSNHVHLLIVAKTLDKFTYLMRDLKSKSSSWVHESFPQHRYFAWQEGYASFSVSFSSYEAVKNYIENQEEHHKKFSFEEEFLLILKKHNMKFDDRFVLG